MRIETLRRLDTRTQEEIEADNIERQVLGGVKRSQWNIPLYGGFLNLVRRSYDVDACAAAAALLAEHGIEIEVHQFKEPIAAAIQGLASVAGADVSSAEVIGERATVKSIDGKRVPRERIPQTEYGWVGRVYPPEE